MDVTLARDPGYLAFMVGLPLLGAILQSLLGARLSSRALAFLGCVAPTAAFACAIRLTRSLMALGEQGQISSVLWSWLGALGISADVAFRFDRLSAVFCLIITGIGALIHLYSCVYMHDEPALGRYFAYLNFFISAMLILVVADNLPLLFVGWEGVGLASFWLIGFWFEDHSNVAAGKKAFVVNRIGDVGLLSAMMTLYASAHTLSLSTLNEVIRDGALGGPIVVWAALGLTLAAIGKSAQAPLYLWLPDAMAGPTPVSALIHAATMVTAGLYLLARFSGLFALAPSVMVALSVIGASTALWAGLIASAQQDLKKVLAFSTVSQLGFMFLGAGAGAFDASLFHVVTHAFFKACLFLGAGSVIHALGGEQDLRKMGFLGRFLPTTTWTFIAATLAITGFPLTSGFVSKDALLAHALSATQAPGLVGSLYALSYGLGLVAALLTSFYMWRLVFLTFFVSGEEFTGARPEPTEGPWPMRMPLVILALLALGAGSLNWPEYLGGSTRFTDFLAPALAHPAVPIGTFWEWIGSAVATLCALLGFLMSFALYGRGRHGIFATLSRQPFACAILDFWRGGARTNEMAGAAFGQPLDFTSRRGLVMLENGGVDGVVRAAPFFLGRLGFLGQLLGGGNLQRYIAVFLLGLALLWHGWLSPRPMGARVQVNDTSFLESSAQTLLRPSFLPSSEGARHV